MTPDLRDLQAKLIDRRAAEPDRSQSEPAPLSGILSRFIRSDPPTPEEWSEMVRRNEDRRRADEAAWLHERCERIEESLLRDESPFAGVADEVVLAAISVSRLRRWALEYDGAAGALLLGATGIGKTAAAIYARRRLTRLRSADVLGPVYQAPVLRAADVGAILREHPLGRGQAGPLRAAEMADLLVIDDLGWEQDRDRYVVADVIAARYDARRPTVATSGLSAAPLAKRYGAAVVRRIVECGGCRGEIVEVTP